MKAAYEVRVEVARRVVYTSLSGIFSEEDMRGWAKAYREKGTNAFRGRKHIVVADMRGMRSLPQHVAKIFGDEIGHARRHGVVLCAHVSDLTIQRLQAARLARENSSEDDVTVDVGSLAEAERVVEEGRERLDDERYTGSIRDSLR